MNNPLMYNDPNGEFWWWAAGAIVGGYLNGVSANNGQWNPGKWNWESTWSAVLGGAIGGAAISGTLGNITTNAGAIKSFLPGIVSGGLSSAFNGSNFLSGIFGGISYSSSIFDNKITSTNNASSYTPYSLDSFGRVESNEKGDEFTPLQIVLNLLNINPHSSANIYNFSLLGSVLIPDDAWVSIATPESLREWSKDYVSYYVNSQGLLEYTTRNNDKIVAMGLTNPINGKIIIAPAHFDGSSIYSLGGTIIHELKHFSNWKKGLFQGIHPLPRALNEISAYSEAAVWTGYMLPGAIQHFQTLFFISIT